MPGRSLDTSGLCVTNTRYTEVPHTHWINSGALSGSGGGGGANSFGGTSLGGATSGYVNGVSATGTSGGIQYTITGIPYYYVTFSMYLTYVAGATQVRVYSGTGTSGTLLASSNVNFAGPVTMNLAGVGTTGTPGAITVVITTPTVPVSVSYSSPTMLFSVDSMGYSWVTYTLTSSLYTQCGDPKDKYEFGFNGQMKTNEIAGVGNHNSALFWEYDTRLGRRWNLDPIDQINISNYACFGNDPIVFTDILGDAKSGPKPPCVACQFLGPMPSKAPQEAPKSSETKTPPTLKPSSEYDYTPGVDSKKKQDEDWNYIKNGAKGNMFSRWRQTFKRDVKDPRNGQTVDEVNTLKTLAETAPVVGSASKALSRGGGVVVGSVGASESPIALGTARSIVRRWLLNAKNLTRAELEADLQAAGFTKLPTGANGMQHFQRGLWKIRLDPPDAKTMYNHMHVNYGSNTNAFDVYLTKPLENYRDPAAHIPIQ